MVPICSYIVANDPNFMENKKSFNFSKLGLDLDEWDNIHNNFLAQTTTKLWSVKLDSDLGLIQQFSSKRENFWWAMRRFWCRKTKTKTH